MFAVVEFAGFQTVIRKGDVIEVPRQKAEPGMVLNLDKVLLLASEGSTLVGKPYVEGAKATAEVVDHVRGPKLIVFRKRRRKAFRRKKGHRQDLTTIRITDILS